MHADFIKLKSEAESNGHTIGHVFGSEDRPIAFCKKCNKPIGIMGGRSENIKAAAETSCN